MHSNTRGAVSVGAELSAAVMLLKLYALLALLVSSYQTAGGIRSLDMVLAHYVEPVEDVARFVQSARDALRTQVECINIYVYHQGQALNRTVFPSDWKVEMMTGNVNREARAYASYLRGHRHADSQFVWFTQALPNGATGHCHHKNYVWARLKHLTERTGMLALCGVGHSDCRTDWRTDWASGARILEMYVLTQRTFCTDSSSWTVFFNGEFIVSRRRILSQPEWVYAAIFEQASAPEARFSILDSQRETNTADPKAGEAASEIRNYSFSYVMERSWNLLFHCLHAEGGRKYVSDLHLQSKEFQCYDDI